MKSIVFTSKPDINKLPGGWEPEVVPDLSKTNEVYKVDIMPGAFILKDVLSESDCTKLIKLMKASPRLESVSVQGRKDIIDDREGSKRTTIWSAKLADKIWDKISEHIDLKRVNIYSHTDWWQTKKVNKIKPCGFWKPQCLTPMLRFMRYKEGGQHYAHYDAGYIYEADNNWRTLQSFVIYLTTNTSGATRFIKDGQNDIPAPDRLNEDWSREVNEEEVLFRSYPIAGSMLVFDHRMCHDVEKYNGAEGDRIIIRGDILYKSI